MELSEQAQSLLEVVVGRLKTARPRIPRSYIGYSECHTALGLKQQGDTFGISLQRQGLNELADWTKYNNLPAITGLIVDQKKQCFQVMVTLSYLKKNLIARWSGGTGK